MLNRIIVFGLTIVFTSCGLNTQKLPIYKNPSKTTEERVEDLLSLMTLEEKASFFTGKDLWHFPGLERLGIPAVQVTDCGHGVTIILNNEGDYTGCATCFPTAVAQAATWNRDIIKEVGAAIARETRATGSSILLAPMVNIHRTPLNGRNYETYSEDPLLTGKLASSFIKGVQSENIAACIKGLTANNQQKNQSELDVQMSERTLHEIYLPNFKIPIFNADPWGIMTAYNGVNGHHTSASKHLITDILKEEWDYKGFVVSDWRGVHNADKSIEAGLDIEMPGPGKYLTTEKIINAFNSGLITKEELDNSVGRILRALIKTKLLDFPKPHLNEEHNSANHHNIALRAAEESIVLLKNDENLLPLNRNVKNIAIIGPNAKEARLGGGGSASVTACYAVSPLEGLKNFLGDSTELFFEEGCGLNGDLRIIYSEFLSNETEVKTIYGLKGEYFNNNDLSGEPVFTRNDEKIDFSWGWAAPGDGLRKNTYSVRWTGHIIPPVTGKYKVGVTCNEAGCRLYLNEKLVIDAWGDPLNETFEDGFVRTSQYVEIDLIEGKPQDIRIEFHKKANKNSFRLEWEIPGMDDPISAAAQLASECEVAIVFAGLSNLFEGGNNDREDILLPGQQNKLIEAVAKANPNTIVVLINGAPVAMPWVKDVKSVVEAFYPGQEGGNAIANILFGKVNPSGKLPDTFPISLEDHPSNKYYPGTEESVNYKEELYVGYRYFDTQKIEPLYPFGHGLSYTSFDYKNIEIEKKDNNYIVSLTLKNTGSVDGAEVVQLYIRDLQSSEARPFKELKNFEKVFLKAGEEREISLKVKEEDLSFFSEKNRKWILESGEFEILIGSSSRDIRLKKLMSI